MRPEAQDITVEILDLHLHRPRVVGGWMPDQGTAGKEFVIQGVDVTYANPRPGATLSLIPAT